MTLWKYAILVLLLTTHNISHSKSFLGEVTKVRDGDTIEIQTLEGEHQVVRLSRIQCAELSTRQGKLLRDIVSSRLLGEIVYVQHMGIGFYGRTLGEVYHNVTHINQWLLDTELCPPYRR